MRVLLVDDDHDARTHFAKEIRERGVEVIEARSLKEAQSQIHEMKGCPFDAVVLDDCVEHGDELDSISIIDTLKGMRFTGHIIGWSASRSNRRKMFEAGATHVSEKGMLIRILQLDQVLA